MTFDKADEVEMLAWQLKQADYPRAYNRALINNLMNGFPPYSEEEVEANNINVNINDLTGTRVTHDARAQYYQAYLKPGNFFKATCDSGPIHKRQERNTIVTKEINKIMKRSLPYMECMRSKFAANVLHGIAPAGFRDSSRWCPEPLGVEDVLVPANTLLTMYNLPFFLVYRSFTAPELIKLTRGPKVDAGWNKKLVDACIEWVDQATAKLMNDQWPQVWSPEKMQERVKSSGGTFYMGDSVPTINVWDLYFWNDDDKVQGWNRRMIIDAWSTPDVSNGVAPKFSTREGMDKLRGQFLFNPGKRKYASKREEIINWQFADLSAVSPFRYHSVRSLGYLLYAVCHLQNRLRCKFNEAIFEQLMVLFRVKGADEAQRALRVDLINKGFVDDSLDFIKAQDRYQINTPLAELGLRENQNIITRSSSSYSPEPTGQGSSVEKTKFQVQSELSAMTSLVSAALLQSYLYQNVENREIFRRFCKKDSPDPDVREFQARCLKQGVPASALSPEQWEIEPERVMGAGNKTMEVAIAEKLMSYRNLYDPGAQRDILRDATLAFTDDPARATALVPEQPDQANDSKFAASLAVGTLMQGVPVPVKDGINHIDYVETLMTSLMALVAKYENTVPDGDDIIGMNMVGQHIGQHIALIAQDPKETARVKQYGDALSKMMNEVKAYAQRYMEQQKAQQQQSGEDAETMGKIKAMMITAQAKAANTREAHAQRTAQREIQFQMEEQRKQREFEAELQRDSGDAQAQHEMQLSAAETTQEMQIKAHQAQMDAMKAQQDLELAKRKAEHEMRLREQEAKQKLELAEKESEHKRKMAEKTAEAQSRAAAKKNPGDSKKA